MQFTVVSKTRGRIRYRSDTKFGYQAAEDLADKIEVIDGIEGVEINARTGSILLIYTKLEALEAAAKTIQAEIPRLKSMPKTIPAGTSVVSDITYWPALRHFVISPLLPLPLQLGLLAQGSWRIIWDGIKKLFKGELTVEVLDMSAILLAIFMRDFKTAATTALLLGVGERFEEWTRRKTMVNLTRSLALNIDTVWIAKDGSEMEVPLSSVTCDDIVIVRSGAAIPVDGVIVAGEATINQASMTGEAIGVYRTVKNTVYAGTVVEDGEIRIQPTGVGEETRLSKIVNFIETSEKAKAGIEGRLERLADTIVPYSFLLAGLTWFFTRNLSKVAAVLMVDYSCALKLATPIAFMSAMKEAANRKMLIKGGKYLEGMASVDTVVFDKTGTLTKSTPSVKTVVPLDPAWSEEEVLRTAACLEEHFPHPVARAVVRAAAERGLQHEEEHAEVQYVVGHGICSTLRGERLLIGSRHYIEEDEKIPVEGVEDKIDALTKDGCTVLYLACGDRLIGLIGVEDPLRPEASAVVAELRAMGIKHIAMITGDGHKTARTVARKLGIDEYYAEVLPNGKADIVLRMEKEGRKVLMVGDGINDSPALSAATVGVTLSDGADLAREVASVVLLGSDLTHLPVALDLSRKTYKRIHQNFRITIGMNTLFLAGGLMGWIMPATGAVLHNLTTLGVSLNAQRPKLPAPPVSDEEAASDEIEDAYIEASPELEELNQLADGVEP
jgi:Cu2+-exporting ATPase